MKFNRCFRITHCRWPLLVLSALACFALAPAHAQIGSGWVQYFPTKKIHLDDENGLQTFSWTSFKQVGSNTPCADYTYNSTNDTETFRIFDGRSNRSEIRLQNEYSTGTRQFEGYVTFYPPLENESLMQIFGSTSGATLTMTRGYASSGGHITCTGTGGGVTYGSTTILTGCYGVEHKINILHDQDNWVRWYVDGVFKCEQRDTETNVVNYQKYGCYGTTSGNVPAIVVWRAVKVFKDGLPPDAVTQPPNAPAALVANPGDAQAFLSWSAVEGATNYIVKRATSAGGTFTQVGTSTNAGFINSGLVNGQTYYYVVSAANSFGEGSESATVSVTPSASVGAILNTNLVAWITFDNNTANDWSGHGNNGVVQGTAAIVTDAQRGKAISLDGIGGKVDLGNASSLDITGQITVAAWVKGTVAGDGTNHNIINRGHGGSPTRELTLRYTSGGDYNAGVYNGGDHMASYPIPGGDVNANTWVHLAGTYDGTNWNLYRNGVLVNSLTDTNGALPMTVGWAIGARGGVGTFERVFNGSIDDVRIYNKALVQTELQQVMTNTVNHAPVFTSHPIAAADGIVGQAYTDSLSANDPDATDTLTFTKINGPAWLNITANGALSGNPQPGDLGTNIFTVRVTDVGGLFDETTMTISVYTEPPVPVIAHWSFDTGTLGTSGGNITNAVDETGNHNMSVGANVGGANGTSGTRNSTAIPSSQSVTGAFNQGLTLTGNGTSGNFLTFPNLTELMAANAPAGYSVSMWVKTASVTFQSYASGLADWGNASSGNRFTYAFGVNSGTQSRGQARWGASGGNDIYARTPTTTVNDGNWRMFTWTFDTDAGILKTYVNGVLLETNLSAASTFQMLDSSSLIGTLGLKNDTGGFINGTITFDEIWVFDGVLNAAQIGNLYTNNSVIAPPVVVTPPVVTGFNVNGTALTISGTNGSSNGQFILLGSTNLVIPLDQWTPLLTNSFDNNGNFNLSTNIVNSSNSQQFYLLRLP